MSHLHSIDKYGGRWTNEEREKFFVFCQLNRATPYPLLCKAFDHLLDEFWKGSISTSFKTEETEMIATNLRASGYRFYNQTVVFLLDNRWVDAIFLKTCTREEMVHSCLGFGYKLASLFLRNTRGENYAVIDTHIKWFLEKAGIDMKLSYLELEGEFSRVARMEGMSMYALDMKIWQERRRK